MSIETIEYIGPRPTKKRKSPQLGGWVLMLAAILVLGALIRPYLSAGQKEADRSQLEEVVKSYGQEEDFGTKLAINAMKLSVEPTLLDPTYRLIEYPLGDVPLHKGTSADLIIRAYRHLGVDLQELVHEDIKQNFRVYPQLWNLNEPDPNIDHRRVPNLQRFFRRHGVEMTPSRESLDYQFGDLVFWRLPGGEAHLGMVVPAPMQQGEKPWVVHHLSDQPTWEDTLFDYKVIGHYRFQP